MPGFLANSSAAEARRLPHFSSPDFGRELGDGKYSRRAPTGGSMELHRHGGEDRVRRVIGKVATARFVVEQKAVLQAGRHVLEQSPADAGLEPVPLVIEAQRQALGFLVLGGISL